MKDQYLVTFHFTSGETMDITYSKERWLEAINKLRQAWMTSCIADESWGINLAQVTHYKVKINQEIVR